MYFERLTGEYAYNEETGNEEPEIELVTIKAALREDRRTSQVEALGIDQTNVALKGFVLSDRSLVQTLDYRQSVQMTLADSVTGGVISGLFFFELVTTPFSLAVEAVVGIPIRGVLRLAGSGERRG